MGTVGEAMFKNHIEPVLQNRRHIVPISLQLKQLENDGLVLREVYGKKPPLKVVYSLTDFGKTFIPVLDAITHWGNQIIDDKGESINSVAIV